MTATWWGITIICVVSLVIWVILSAKLYKRFFKRFYDVILSSITIVCFSWLYLILIVVGAIAMRGNPFFTQKRPGKIEKRTGKEKIFKLVKFRTMTNAKDDSGDLLPDDKRLNKYGRFLRSTSLDEIPELFNIFVGSMSIVGPRPQLVKDMLFMSDAVRTRHSVRPGLTGLAQVNGRNNIGWDEKFDFDLLYIKKISLWSDIAILFKTFIKVFKRSDVTRDGTESDLDYGNWLVTLNKITQDEYDRILSQGMTANE